MSGVTGAIDPNLMYMTAIVSLVGSVTYCIKKVADSGIACRSKCCKDILDVQVDTNEGHPTDPDFYQPDTERERSNSGGSEPESARV